jgi:hypothetical protein
MEAEEARAWMISEECDLMRSGGCGSNSLCQEKRRGELRSGVERR